MSRRPCSSFANNTLQITGYTET